MEVKQKKMEVELYSKCIGENVWTHKSFECTSKTDNLGRKMFDNIKVKWQGTLELRCIEKTLEVRRYYNLAPHNFFSGKILFIWDVYLKDSE